MTTPSEIIQPGLQTNSRAVAHLLKMAQTISGDAPGVLTQAAEEIAEFDQEVPAIRGRQIITTLGKALDILAEQGGSLVIRNDVDVDREWILGLTFGQEEEGSDMAAGAAYGTGHDADTAILGLAQDLGLTW